MRTLPFTAPQASARAAGDANRHFSSRSFGGWSARPTMLPWNMASEPAASGPPSDPSGRTRGPLRIKRLHGSRSFYGVLAALLLVLFVDGARFFDRVVPVEQRDSLALHDVITCT